MTEVRSEDEQCTVHGAGPCICLGARYWMDEADRLRQTITLVRPVLSDCYIFICATGRSQKLLNKIEEALEATNG